MTDRTFDYRPRHDQRSREYRMTAAPADLLQRSRYWTPGPVLDQGREGACVGFGVTAEALASPVRWAPVDPNTPGPWARLNPAQRAAIEVYRRAQQLDPWEGENYSGTSVLAGMKVGQERGWWTGYRWAFSMPELRAALEEGPVVVGVEWREGMYEAPGGIVTVSGTVVGGHCVVLTGYTPRHRLLKTPAYRWRNSWSEAYGLRGSAYVKADDLDSILFQAGGESAVPMGRKA